MKRHQIRYVGMFAVFAALLLTLSIAAFAAPTCTTDCYVDATSGSASNTGESGSPLSSIQDAINQVSVNGTVHVAAGVYTEQVVISKSLSLVGADEATTEIALSPTSVTRQPGNNVYQILVDSASTVSISNLTVSGPHLSYVAGDNYSAVRVLGDSNVNLTDVTVESVYITAVANGVQTGNGIYYGEIDGATATVSTGSGTLTNVTVSNFQKRGIHATGVGSHITVTNALVEEGSEFDWSAVIAQNGIQLTYGATADISDSAVNDLHCTIPSSGSSGCFPDYFVATAILLYSAGSGTTIDNVTLSNNGVGIHGYISGNVSVTNSTINNSLRGAITNDQSTFAISNTVVNGGWDGVETYATAAGQSTTLTGGGIMNLTGTAFLVEESGAATGSSITGANISGNEDGVEYIGSGSINATCNWWGSASGPSGAAAGTGNSITAGATFTPWLSAAAPGGYCIGQPAAVKIIKVSGDNQTGAIGSNFAPLVVKVTDASNNPVSGQTVQFAVLTRAASAIFSPNSGQVVTDSNGLATIVATANDQFGSYDVIVSTDAVFSLFSLTNGPDSVATPVLVATADGFDTIDLSWTGAFSSVDTFELFRSSDNVNFTSIATPANGTLAYESTGLTCNATYYYRLDVTNSFGSASSNVASTSTDACPAAVLSAAAAGATKIDVSWTGTFSSSSTFELFHSVDNVNFSSIATPASGVLSYQHTGLTCDTTHYYRLDVTSGSVTVPSNVVTATTTACSELLVNGSFEDALPGTWVGLNLSGDKRKVDAANAFDGTAALLFKGSPDEKSSFKQVATDISMLSAGDTLYLSAAFKSAAASPAVRIQLVIKDSTGSVKVPMLAFLASSPTYTEASGTYVLANTPTNVVVKIINKSKAGKAYIDQVSLTVNDLGARALGGSMDVLPLPSAPEAFRGNN